MIPSTVRSAGLTAVVLVGSLMLAAPAAYADACDPIPTEDVVTTIVHPPVVRTVPAVTHREWLWERTTSESPAEDADGDEGDGARHEQTPGPSAVAPAGDGWTPVAGSEVVVTDAPAREEVVEEGWVEYLLSPPEVSADCTSGAGDDLSGDGAAPTDTTSDAPGVGTEADVTDEVAPTARTRSAAPAAAVRPAALVADELTSVAAVSAGPATAPGDGSVTGWLVVLGLGLVAGTGTVLGARRSSVR